MFLTRNVKYKGIQLCEKSLFLYVYAFSSFHYSFVGLACLLSPIPPYHLQRVFPIFMCAQGPVSFLSDVVYVHKANHWSRQLDRTFALYNTMLALIVLESWKPCFLECAIILFGLLVKPIDSYYYRNGTRMKYMVAHFIWHTILPGYALYKTLL
jgi:hypothetical protein